MSTENSDGVWRKRMEVGWHLHSQMGTLTAAGPARQDAPALAAAEGRHGKNGHSLHHLCLLIEDLVSLFTCNIVKNRELCLFSEEG